jgi:hypothetical protein
MSAQGYMVTGNLAANPTAKGYSGNLIDFAAKLVLRMSASERLCLI